MVGSARHRLGLGTADLERELATLRGEDARARADLVDPAAGADLRKEVDDLAGLDR